MKRRSFAGPLMLVVIGSLFLWRNLHPEAPVLELAARYWPFLLIGWGVIRLAEVLIWRDRRNSGFSGGEVVLIVFLCLAGSALWAGHQHGFRLAMGGLQMWGEQYEYPISARASAANMKRVTFENSRGSIRVIGSDTQEIVVSGRKWIRAWSRDDASVTDRNTNVDIVPQGDRLLIRTNQDRAPENQRITEDLEVTVPRGVTVEARGRSGDLEITDVLGGVEIATERGDVRLARVSGNARLDIGRSEIIRATDIKGKIDLQGRGSDIELENVEGQVTINGGYTGTLEFKNLARPLVFEGARNTELRVQAVPGRISMDLGQLTASNLVGPVRLVTRSRDVRLERFTESLELETERGDIELMPALPMPSMEVRAGTGRIDLVLPPKAAFTLEATAERGSVANDFGAPIEKTVDGPRSTLKGRVGDGPSIKLTSNRGSVSVRKEGTLPSGDPQSEDRPKQARPKTTEI